MIKLSKDKIIRYRCGNGEHDEITEEVNDLIPFLNEEIEIIEDFTLKNLFNIVMKNRNLYETVFASHLGHYPLHLYSGDMNKNSKVKKRIDFNYLEIEYKCGLYPSKGKTNNPDKPDWYNNLETEEEFDMFLSFHGIKEDSGESPYSIEFHSLNELKDIPIRINNNVGVHDFNKDSGDVIFVGKKEFIVYDFLTAIFYEISFNGSPEQRDEKWKEIQKDLDNMSDFSDGDKE